MPRNPIEGTLARLYALERKLQQHHTDIQRLWRRQPNSVPTVENVVGGLPTTPEPPTSTTTTTTTSTTTTSTTTTTTTDPPPPTPPPGGGGVTTTPTTTPTTPAPTTTTTTSAPCECEINWQWDQPDPENPIGASWVRQGSDPDGCCSGEDEGCEPEFNGSFNGQMTVTCCECE